jgi:hypothetical protein
MVGVFAATLVLGQPADTTRATANDSLAPLPAKLPQRSYAEWINTNAYLPVINKATAVSQIPHRKSAKDLAFYFMLGLLLYLGIIRTLYSRYFSNLLRVFFNTSLRQSQLTDQLLQAKLPSLFFNVLFLLVSSYYLFLLLIQSNGLGFDQWIWWPVCLLAIGGIYVLKYSILKLAGWLTGYRQQAETYIFITFLINKMIGLLLIPGIVIMSFSQPLLVQVTTLASFVIIGLLLVMRFVRSYGLMQHNFRVSRLHFFLYIIGLELLPLLLIYKTAVLFVDKNL